MPLHPQAEAVLSMIAEMGLKPFEENTPEEARAVMSAMTPPSTEPVQDIRDVDAGGVPARLYRPVAADGLGLLVYFHGGGWVIGNLESHDAVCRSLANRMGHAVLSVDYRLAPEHPFPAPFDDAVQATRWAHANAVSLGCDPDRIAVGGDSAGGNLAAAVAQLAPVPLRYQLLIYPVTDGRMGSQSYVDNADGYFLTAAGMTWFFGHYLSGGDGGAGDPRVSPLLADDSVLAATPPALVVTAEFDPLRDEGNHYAARLAAAGVPVSHVCFSGMFHAFFGMPDAIDDAGNAQALAAQAVKTALER